MHDRPTRRTGAAVLLALLGLVLFTSTASAEPDTRGHANDGTVELHATASEEAERQWRAAGTSTAIRLIEYARASQCNVPTVGFAGGGAAGPCPADDAAIALLACDAADAIEPLWMRTRTTPAAPWTSWWQVNGWSCDAPTLPVMTLADFRRLPLDPPVLRVQPDQDWVLVNIDTIAMTEPTVQNLTTTLLGFPIQVRATSSSYTWDFGDGSPPLTTTSPGHPWPDHDVSHAYTRTDTARITLTTAWTGEYLVGGTTTWQDITGTASTSSTTPPIDVVEARSHLVADTCRPGIEAPGCP